MKTYGLIGFPLAHSFSARYFGEKFANENITDCEYVNIPLKSLEELRQEIVRRPTLRGFNVTIPYKEQIIPYLSSLESQAAQVGAVNCVKIDADGSTRGYNADIYGFKTSLIELIGNQHPEALILGSGGASKAVTYVLEELGLTYNMVSRRGEFTYNDLTPEIVASNKLIINATPLGTYPDTDSFPTIPYEAIGQDHILYDLVYNPPITRFMQLGQQRGATVMNGMRMLKLQAEASWKIWNE